MDGGCGGLGGRGCGAPCRTGAGSDGTRGRGVDGGLSARDEGTVATRTATQVPLTGIGLLFLTFGAKDSDTSSHVPGPWPWGGRGAGCVWGGLVLFAAGSRGCRLGPPVPSGVSPLLPAASARDLLCPRTRRQCPGPAHGTRHLPRQEFLPKPQQRQPHTGHGVGFAAVPSGPVLYHFVINAVFAVGFADKGSMFLRFSMEGALGGLSGAPGQHGGGRGYPRHGGLFSDRGALFGGRPPLCTNV